MRTLNYIIFSAILLLFASCETEVDLKLNSAEPRLVIDASIKEMGQCIVLLTMSQAFENQEDYKTVSVANITLKNSKGEVETLTETIAGVYISQMLGKIGETYILIVEVDGEQYEARETVPAAVPIKDIRPYKMEIGNKKKVFPCISYDDPEGVDNYYLYNVFVNGRRVLDPKIDDDKYFDGKYREPILAFNDEQNNNKGLEENDHVLVEMQSISKGAYDFYKSISSPGGSQNSNPVSNFSGKVLGVFKAYSSDSKEMTITAEDL